MGEARARLGDRVKRLRSLQQKTQEDVAEGAGLSYKFIGEVERGVANPSVDTLERLAHALGVRLADLFDDRTTIYAMRERDVPVVREVVASLEDVIARLERVAPAGRKGRRRSPVKR